jgi:Bacterial Ig-like domain (group 3)/FG-GAP-like repeat
VNTFALLRNALWATCLCVALIVFFSCDMPANAQASPAIFLVASPRTLPGDSSPIFIGDFNGDGKPDLAYIELISSGQLSLGIQLNFGGSAPTTVTTPLCVAGATQPSFADVNNDKKLDLVYSCNGFLTIQLGNGDGTFQPPAYYAKFAGAPVFADLNGDGYLDIAAFDANPTATPQVSVFLNQGATAPGVFGSPVQYAVPNGATYLSVGDFNGDGKQDLITPIISSVPGAQLAFNGFSVLYGNGDGTLNPPKTQSIAPFNGFTTGDFNGDGVTDLAFLLAPTPNSLFTSVQILLGSNSGTFSQGAALPVAAAPPPQQMLQPITAVALTSGGNLDLLVTTNVLNVIHGDGKGGFTPTGTYAVSPQPIVGGYAGYLFADVNGDGNQDLIVAGSSSEFFIFLGNGGSTFQVPTGTPVSGLAADVNNDGIADMVFLPAQGGSYFGTAIGRGDGSFAILNQTVALPPAQTGYVLTTGDFNGDGKTDAIAIQPGSPGHNAVYCVTPDAQLLSYLGSGDGRFQAKGTALALGVSGAGAGVTGDFNSDGNLDIIVPYSCPPSGLLFVAGHGDGTFASPIDLNAQGAGNPLVGDLNNDKKLDFIWGSIVYLGNGDGTFKQLPLTIPSGNEVIALADLNGDGILDVVSGSGLGSMIYAGKGDGTFASTAFYTVPLPPSTYQYSFATGDVNGDGNPDLLLGEQGGAAPFLAVYFGDGHGNFTQDTNTYFLSALQAGFGSMSMTPNRLNNQAPALPNDRKLDALAGIIGGYTVDGYTFPYVVSLLNQTNPPPAKPAPLTSTTALQTSLASATPGAAITLTASVFGTNPTGSVSFSANGNNLGTEVLANGTATLPTSFANAGSYTVTATYAGDSNNTASTSSPVGITITPATTATTLQTTASAGNVNGQITLKATVSGDSPTGSVLFAAGTTSLGTATLTNGVATLQTSFAAAGSYATTATYQGDQNNAASTSSAVTIVIAAPDFTVTATPTSGTVPPGQTATFTFTVTPAGGYAGTVKFSCGPLPAQAACSFSPASVAPSGGSPVSSTLTVTTVAVTAALNPNQRSTPSLPPWIPAGGLAVAGAMGIAFAPRKIKRWNRQLRLLSWGLLLASIPLSVLGCGGGNSSPSTPATTAAGSYTISVNVTDSAGGPQHAVSVALVVQ